MLVGVKMILTVLVIPFTLGAVSEFQMLSILFRPAADGALMMVLSKRFNLDLILKIPFALNLLWVYPV